MFQEQNDAYDEEESIQDLQQKLDEEQSRNINLSRKIKHLEEEVSHLKGRNETLESQLNKAKEDYGIKLLIFNCLCVLFF